MQFPLATVASGLLTSTSLKLYAPCHDTHWEASTVELEQIREYLGAPWIDAVPN